MSLKPETRLIYAAIHWIESDPGTFIVNQGYMYATELVMQAADAVEMRGLEAIDLLERAAILAELNT